MTWTWTLTKMGVGIGLGYISSNPLGWTIGIPTATLIKLKNEENLNSSNLTLSDKETAQRWAELSKDYQVSASLGILGKGLGSAISHLSNKTLSIGRQAGKEIAINGFKTELAKDLIADGQFLSAIEENIRLIDNLKKLGEKYKESKDLAKDLLTSKNEEEFIINIRSLIQAQILLIDELELLDLSDKNLLNSIRETVLELNQKNVKIYVDNQKNYEEHRLINREINKILTRIKEIQKKLHDDHNCCEDCRFC